jgi:hypothetical protein
MKKYFITFFILFIINVFFSTQEPTTFQISINLEEGGFLINDRTTSKICPQWIPSLFMPILYAPINTDITNGTIVPEKIYELIIPVFNSQEKYKFSMFKNVPFLQNDYKCTLIKPLIFKQNNCYFGLSSGIKYENMEEEKAI